MVLKISIVTVVRNCADTIEDTIKSVAVQNYNNKEHLIVDGASTDSTLDIVNRYRQQFAAVVSEPDGGMFDAMNKGIARATGDIIGFLNADDTYVGATVLTQIAAEFDNPNVDACYSDLVYVDRQNPQRVVRYWKSRSYVDGLFESGWMPAHPTFFVRRQFYEEHGGFDLSYPRQSDFELAMRLFLKGRIRAVYIPKVLVRMLSGGASSGVSHILLGNLEAYRACRRHNLNVTPLFMFKKIFSRIPQFLRRA